MGTLNVNLEGSALNTVSNPYVAQAIDGTTTTCININSGKPLDELNSISLDNPANPSNRHVYAANISEFLPLLVKEPRIITKYSWREDGTVIDEGVTKYKYVEYSETYDLNFPPEVHVCSCTGIDCCQDTQTPPETRDPVYTAWDGYYGRDGSTVETYYACNKKVNEANIPYIHGELINKGTIPSETLPTTQYLGTSTSCKCVLTKRAALGLTAQTARAITYDNGGWLNLWGYGDDGAMYIISSAQVFQIDSESQVQEDLTCSYPQSGG